MPTILLLLALVSISCSGGGGSEVAATVGQAGVASPAAASPDAELLAGVLATELARLGIDPDRETSVAPSGEANRVFDLSVRVVGESGETATVELAWTERLTGDYNQDGYVNATDLTPLGQYYNSRVTYDAAGQHDGFSAWPSGDPTGDGALNWRLARVDGDRNGLIGLGDITTIAQHWNENLGGYRIYLREGETGDFTMVEDPEAPGEALILTRDRCTSQGAGQPVRYTWTLTMTGSAGAVYIAPYNADIQAAGPESNAVTITRNIPPVAQLSWSAVEGETGAVRLSALDSYDPDGTIASYEWDLDGDGEYELATGTVGETTRSYETAGNYPSTVRVTDDGGATDTAAVTVEISETGLPTAVITPIDDFLLDDQTYQWSAAGSTDSDGEIVEYWWDMEGTDSWTMVTEPGSPEHQYAGGDYSIGLKVVDDAGNTNETSLEITVFSPPCIALLATETDLDDGRTQVDFKVQSFASSVLSISRLWIHCGDGETIEFGTATSGTGTHVYEPGEYVYYACAEEGTEQRTASRYRRFKAGGGYSPQSNRPLLVIRNDNDVYGANYDALIDDLDALGRNYVEVDYYSGISDDHPYVNFSPVIWYRGGPGSDTEPQVYTRLWYPFETDDYLAFMRNGNRVLLMSQSHGIYDNMTPYGSTGWDGWFGWDMLDGSIPLNEARHPWASGATLESGIGWTGYFGYLKMSPRNLQIDSTLNGKFAEEPYGDPTEAAERYDGAGSSGYTPINLGFGINRQVCGMGCYKEWQMGRFADGLALGVSTDPKMEGEADFAYLSWGTQLNAPYENLCFWPPPYTFNPGTGSLWIVGYSWAETTVTNSDPAGMTRAQLLQNMLAWLEADSI